MSEKFIKALQEESNVTTTENGMDAYASTLNGVLDLFATIGAMRTRKPEEIIHKFLAAFEENHLLALKTLFYARNIRGGLGERRTARIIYKFLADFYPEFLKINLHLIPHFGRWDDLFVLLDTKLKNDVLELIYKQFMEDYKNYLVSKPISLLAKWLPSNESKNKVIREYFKLPQKQYRQMVAILRKYSNVVEVKMCAKEFDTISYSGVPSKAMTNYRKAFDRHDHDRFSEYLELLKKGETKINASTLFPYDLIEKYYETKMVDRVVEEQWKALPNYVDGDHNILIMADTSGSMRGRPLATSVGLAIYFAERNSGPYHNKFITFASKPSYVTLFGETLIEKLSCIPCIVDSTNIMAAMKLILDSAVAHNLKNEDLPKALVIISDMEFDQIQVGETNRNFFLSTIEKEFNKQGYELPKIVFWNVNSRNNTFHATSNDKGVYLVSGQSVSAFKGLLTHLEGSPMDYVLKVLNNELYDVVKV